MAAPTSRIGGWSVTLLVELALILAAAQLTHQARFTCEDALEAYADRINHHDLDGLLTMVSPADRARYGDQRLRTFFESEYGDVSELTWTHQQLSPSSKPDACGVQTRADYLRGDQGVNPRVVTNEGDYHVFERHEHRWYLQIPKSDDANAWSW